MFARQLRPLLRSPTFPARGIRAIRPLPPAIRFSSTNSSSTATTPHETHDILILGGGPAGLLLAAALRSSHITSRLSICLLDSQPLTPSTPPPTGYSNRCVSLTPSSLRFLRQIGAETHIDKSRIQPYTGMKVWDGVSGAAISFNHDLLTTTNEIATMIENNNLTSALLRRIQELGGVEIVDRTKVRGINYGEDDGTVDYSGWPVVELENGRRVAGRLLVGADGANSPVRTFAGIETRGWDYGRQGVVATLKLAPGSGMVHRTAYQRFLPTGPVAMLPLPGDWATLVWTTTPDVAARMKGLKTHDMAALVNAAFSLSTVDVDFISHLSEGIVDEVAWRQNVTPPPADRSLVPPRVVEVQEKTVASFPLKFRHADSYIAERIALVGDAAHSVHPLAGQGLNQGIGDVESLVKTVEDAVIHGMDVGSLLALEPYPDERYLKNHVLMGVVDKLHKLYGTDAAPVVAVRSLGLKAVDMVEGVKGWIMKQAAGRT